LDLYYRLNVIQVLLPPLRDRREDILPLAESFIKHYNSKFKRKMEGLSHGAAAILMGYDWPGNVRELRNVIERAMVLEESDWIQTSSLQILSEKSDLPLVKAATLGADDRFEVSLEEAEKSLLVKALEKAEGNQTRAAVLLGITRDTLRYKIKKFNLR
jgi:transcriptional regulator with PAS, ATPase and Fis domain